ncbi:MAG: hypothetical protein JNK53_02130, partial [Phycisphaerae bacterium]|nr:hypothetical protein [Phycisphaerae bacterium]
MRRIATRFSMLALPAVSLAIAASASAQSLSTRIQGVMEQRAAEQQARYATRTSMLRTLMQTGITVNFDQTPAKEAFAYVKKVLGIDLVYRWSTDPGATSGIDPEMP